MRVTPGLIILGSFGLFAEQAHQPAASLPRPLVEVARFRALDQRQPTGELELSVTVPTRGLLYRQRLRRVYQASATLELSLVRAADSQPVWRETVALRPPVLTDTAQAVKNPFTVLRRVLVPVGSYTLRTSLRDNVRPATGQPAVAEQPLTVSVAAGPAFSDVLLLAQPAARVNTAGADNVRGGYQLARAPAGLYARGANAVFFYAELTGLPPNRPVRLRYRLLSGAAGPTGSPAAVEATLTPPAGRPTPVVGQLLLGALLAGPFTLVLEARDAATNKLLASQHQTGSRNPTDYIQAGDAAPAARP